MIGQIFNVIAPVILCAAIGFVWAKRGTPFATGFVTTLVTKIGIPCLVFASLVKTDLDANVLGTMGLMALATITAFAVIAASVLKLAGTDLRAFLPPMMFANTANMGIPLCMLAFGD